MLLIILFLHRLSSMRLLQLLFSRNLICSIVSLLSDKLSIVLTPYPDFLEAKTTSLRTYSISTVSSSSFFIFS